MCQLKTIEVVKNKRQPNPERMDIYRRLVQILHQLESLYISLLETENLNTRVYVYIRRSEAPQGSAAHFYQYVEANYRRLTRPYLARIFLNLIEQFRRNSEQNNSLE